jgi:hypothetical protein
VLLNYHIGRSVLGSLCVGDLVRLGLSGVRVAVHKKGNKITSDIKLVFYSSTITMTHGPINIRISHVLLCYKGMCK